MHFYLAAEHWFQIHGKGARTTYRHYYEPNIPIRIGYDRVATVRYGRRRLFEKRFQKVAGSIGCLRNGFIRLQFKTVVQKTVSHGSVANGSDCKRFGRHPTDPAAAGGVRGKLKKIHSKSIAL